MFNDSTLPIECRLPNVEALELVKFILYGPHDDSGNSFSDIFANLTFNDDTETSSTNAQVLEAASSFIRSILDAHAECYSESVLAEFGESLLLKEPRRDFAFPVSDDTLREVEAQLTLASMQSIIQERKGSLMARSLEACTASSELELTKLTKIIQGEEEEDGEL